MPLVESFEEACEFHGVNPETVIPDLSCLPESMRVRTEATIRLDLVNDAIRENKPFDWNDYDQEKWRAWADLEKDDDVNPTGFRLYAAYCDSTITNAGARLSFHERAQLLHSFNTFPDLWEKVLKG